MLFWTVVFFTMNLVLLVRKPFRDALIKTGELNIQKAEGKITEKEFNEKVLNHGCIVLLFLPAFIGELIYLIYAIKIDPMIYPSVILLAYLIIGTVFNKTKKNDLVSEEGRQKYRLELYKGKTLKSALINLIYCCYFGYMFYVLVF